MIFAERIYTILEMGTDLFPVFFYGNFSKKKKQLSKNRLNQTMISWILLGYQENDHHNL